MQNLHIDTVQGFAEPLQQGKIYDFDYVNCRLWGTDHTK